MQIIKYADTEDGKEALEKKAQEKGKELYETNVSISFRIFCERGNTLEFHVIYF